MMFISVIRDTLVLKYLKAKSSTKMKDFRNIKFSNNTYVLKHVACSCESKMYFFSVIVQENAQHFFSFIDYECQF